MPKLFLQRFRCGHCCVSVIMRPSGFFISPHFGPSKQSEFETHGLECACWNNIKILFINTCYKNFRLLKEKYVKVYTLRIFSKIVRVTDAQNILIKFCQSTQFQRKFFWIICLMNLLICIMYIYIYIFLTAFKFLIFCDLRWRNESAWVCKTGMREKVWKHKAKKTFVNGPFRSKHRVNLTSRSCTPVSIPQPELKEVTKFNRELPVKKMLFVAFFAL